jgi:hypothetical protein
MSMKSRVSLLVAVAAAAGLWGANAAHADPQTITLNLSDETLVGHIPSPPPVTSGDINGATFSRNFTQPAGTGFIDPFVRIQSGQQEAGYNTEGDEEFETKDAGGHNWDHGVQLKDVGTTSIGGVDYIQFFLDLNESNANTADKHLLSMFEFEVYLDDTPFNDDYAAGLGDKIYDMDELGDATVVLDHDLAPGSGKFDMVVNVKRDLFGTDLNQFLYLYTAFGDRYSGPPDLFYDSDAGFEEWTVQFSPQTPPPPPPVVPVPAAVWGGMGLFGMIGAGKWFRRRRNED